MSVNPKKPINPEAQPEDKNLDVALRPQTWDEYAGQEKIKKNLQIILGAAKKRSQAPDHLLFYGASGTGKTSLSYLVAKEINVNIRVTAGPVIERAGDLAAILTNLEPNSILFIDEIHRLNRIAEEYLYPAMEDFKLNIILGKGPMARTMELDLPRFTLIGATTRPAALSAPLRNRFGASFQLNYYEHQDIEKIINRSSRILEVKALPEAIQIIAQRSRFTPRVANRLLKRVRDVADMEGRGIITKEIAEKTFKMLEIDSLGLTNSDVRILKTIINKFGGGPVGLQALSAAAAEEQDTILDVYEPYLMRLGMIERTSRGRMAAKLAYRHFGLKSPSSQTELLWTQTLLKYYL